MKYLIYLVCVLSILSCSGNKNYPKAYGFEQNGKALIILKGKREYMAHDVGSLLSGKTYEDSIVLSVPSLNDGIIKGHTIPVKEGYYKYVGEISIQGNRLTVNLSYDNTDDKKIQPLSWNGNYELFRN